MNRINMASFSLKQILLLTIIPLCTILYGGVTYMYFQTPQPYVHTVEVKSLGPALVSTTAPQPNRPVRKALRKHTGLCRNSTFTHIYTGGSAVIGPPEFTVTPRIVYYFWCSRATKSSQFEFRHFLSVKSAIHFLNPDTIFLYYDEFPKIDDSWYNTWLMELQTIHQFIVTVQVPLNSTMCTGDDPSQPNQRFVAEKLRKTGGVYIREHIMLTDRLPGLATGTSHLAKSLTGKVALASGNREGDFESILNQSGGDEPFLTTCDAVDSYGKQKPESSLCLDLDKEAGLYPKDLWCCGEDTAFKRLGKLMLYGQPDTPAPTVHKEDIIPKIGHYCSFGGKNMDFLFYLSVLSCIHVLNLDNVYIHGDLPPAGSYWKLLQNSDKYKDRVHWINRHKPITIYGNEMRAVAHKSDVTCTDVMIKYGGVHVDPDVLFTRPFEPEIWRYEAIFGFACCTRQPFPMLFNWGVSLAAPQAKYWRLIKQSQRCFIWHEWDWNSGRLIYKIYERNPDLLLGLATLQITCTKECYTRYLNDPETGFATNSNATGWLNNVYSIHFTGHGTAFKNRNSAMRDTTLHGAVARLVMKASGLD